MGNLCIPDDHFEPLELTISPPAQSIRRQSIKERLTAQEEEKPEQRCADERKGAELGQEEGVLRLMGAFRVSDMTILSGLAGSDYSKLNRHQFRQVIVPPSSARLTVIDRLQCQQVVPDELFIVAIAQSQFKRLRSFKLPLKYKRAASLK